MNQTLLDMHKYIAVEWARYWLLQPSNAWCIIDTETTGLMDTDEVVQVGMVDGSGYALMDILVRPSCDISPQASAVHHITAETVKDAPTFFEVLPSLRKLWKGRTIIMYNSAYDMRMLRQSAEAWGTDIGHEFKQVQCAMEMYAMYAGQWNEKHQSFRWQKLGHGGTHGAVDDCLATLRVMAEMQHT